jgi:hypothetical protein
VNPSGNRAYFASNIDPASGRDIYFFDLPETLRPDQVSFMKGVVYDKDTKRRLRADFELIDLNKGDLINKSQSDSVTESFCCIPLKRNYYLMFQKKVTCFFCFPYGVFIRPFLRIFLNPIRVGELLF